VDVHTESPPTLVKEAMIAAFGSVLFVEKLAVAAMKAASVPGRNSMKPPCNATLISADQPNENETHIDGSLVVCFERECRDDALRRP
jgi:hypothetical protein